MKKAFTTFLFLTFLSSVYSQISTCIPATFGSEKEDIFNYFVKHVNPTQELINNNLSGIVYSSLIINELGEVDSYWIIKSPDSKFNRPITKMFKKMPNWNPAQLEPRPIGWNYS